MTRSFTATDLVYPGSLPDVNTIDDIIFLGSYTIRGMIQAWRGWGRNVAQKLKYASEEDVPSLQSQKRLARERINQLLELEKRAEQKPPLPRYRPVDWFVKGEIVYIWRQPVNAWQPMHVLEVNKFHCMVVVGTTTLPITDTMSYRTNVGEWYGVARPEILKEGEYHYLRINPGFAALWIRRMPEEIKYFNRFAWPF